MLLREKVKGEFCFYAFVTLYRDHFIDGMRNVMTFVFVIQGRGWGNVAAKRV
jgi:hypothetical protein